MDAVAWVTFAIGAVTILFTIIGFFLSQKDAKQALEISDLFRKHEEDAQKLANLELKIAEQHYPKPEIDKIMDRFKGYFDERFDRLEKVIRKDS